MAGNLSHMALFCDEAGKETDRYLAVGGLVIAAGDAPRIRAETSRHFRRIGINSEMKWNKTKSGNVAKYREMVHYVFQLIEDGVIRFHCLLVDFQRFDHNLRPDGSPQESLKRMYYQLILHRLCKKHGADSALYAFPDKARELQGLDGLKSALNTDSRFRFRYRHDCLRAIEFRNSEDEVLLQLNDIVLGGVCYQKNRRFDDEGAGHAKANLAGYILGKTGLPHYEFDTPLGAEKLSIWNLRSQHLKGGAQL
jgi:hypothetical protein